MLYIIILLITKASRPTNARDERLFSRGATLIGNSTIALFYSLTQEYTDRPTRMQTFNLPAPGCPFTNLFPESAFSHGTLSLQEVLATFPVHGCYKYLNFPSLWLPNLQLLF